MSLRSTKPVFTGAWWSRLAERLLPLPPGLTPSLDRPAKVLRALLLIHLVVNVLGIGVAPFAQASTVEWFVAITGLLGVVVGIPLLRMGWVRASGVVEMSVLSVLTSILVVWDGNNASGASGILVCVVLAAGLLLGRRAVRFATIYALTLTTLVYAASFIHVIGINEDPFYGFGEFLLAVSAILFGSTLVAHGLSVLEGALERSRRVAEALRASEERWRNYIERANDLIFTLDLEGRVRTVNRAVCETLGYMSEDMVGRFALDFVAPADRARAAEAIATVLRGATTDQWEYEVVSASGQSILLEIRSRTLYDEARRPNGSLHTARDLSDRRRADAALRQVQKQESLALISGGVAHDFNNLLTVIMGQTSTARAILPAGSPAREQLRRVLHAADRAASLVRQLLAFSGQAGLSVVPVDLNALIEDDADLLEAGLPGGVQLDIVLGGELPMVEADRSGLQQLVMNLVLNGAQACVDEGGTVRLATDAIDLPDGLSATASRGGLALPPGRYVRLVVSDDGVGMAPDTLEQIFDPFFTTKDSGHGLGLAATLGIVRSHRGGLSVDSAPDGGTRFTLYFPAMAETDTSVDDTAVEDRAVEDAAGAAGTTAGTVDRARSAGASVGSRPPHAGTTADSLELLMTTSEFASPSPSPSPSESDAQLHASSSATRDAVLVIDDEGSVREAISDVLAVHGVRVFEAGDGSEGIATAMAHRAEIRLILLDLTMPGLSGEETCQRLHEATPELPIVLISGYTQSKFDGRYEAYGVSEFLAKPFSFTTLSELVARYPG